MLLFVDLRERVARLVASGVSRRAAARRFRVSKSLSIEHVQHEARSGSAAPVRHGVGPTASSWRRSRGLIAEVEAEPDITMPELANRSMTRHGVSAAPAFSIAGWAAERRRASLAGIVSQDVV
ncbi:hypothetical protein [Rhizobium quercicola]|uniref:hypothetical protein n=1 Tax=Rhizobium quercicola TaxID=2901226 RepID=UPI0022B24085|nr:hypothetical protein [Rhizobium quercicola]